MRKRLLFLTPRLPMPLHSGERWVFSLIRGLAERHDVSLLTFVEPNPDPTFLAYQLNLERRWLKKLYAVPRAEFDEAQSDALPNLARPYRSKTALEALRRALEEQRPDVVHAQFFETAHFIDALPPDVPAILTDHDVSHFQPQGSYLREDNAAPHGNASAQWLRRRLYAETFYRRFRAVTVFSEADAVALRSVVEGLTVRVVPLTTDVGARAGRDQPPRERDSLVFVGNYCHFPNEDAAVHLCRDVLPRVQSRLPLAKAYVVGSAPTPSVRALASDSVIVTGTVPSVETYLRRAGAFVASVRIGGGVKGKILEAMAAETPIVCTPGVAAGFDGELRDAFLVGEGAVELAEHALRLLENPQLGQRLARRGREIVEQRFDTSRAVESFERLYSAPTRASPAAQGLDARTALVIATLEQAMERGLAKAGAKRQGGPIKELYIEVTHRCDLKCFMCEHWRVQFNDPSSPQREMSADDIERWVGESKLLDLIEQVVITGGEPWLRRDVVRTIAFLRRRFPGARLIVLSNLWNTESLRRRLNELKVIGVGGFHVGSSLDGVGAAHDRVRGQPGAFDGLVESAAMLRREHPEIGFGFTFTITPQNYGSLYETFDFATRRLGATFGAQLVIQTAGIETITWPRGAMEEVERQIDRILVALCSAQTAQACVDALLGGRPNGGGALWRELMFWWHLRRFNRSSERFFSDCLSGYRYAMFEPEGGLFFCPAGKTRTIGNVLETPFDELWASPKAQAERCSMQDCRCRAWIRCIANPIVDRLLALDGK